jgi:large subunit ribosomal protein L5
MKASYELVPFGSLYKDKIVPDLKSQFGFSNPMQIPKIEKICINMGIGKESVQNSKVVNEAFDQLMLISGQRPVITKAKKSIAGFKLRQGVPVGVKVTLRGARALQFLEKLVYVALPRVRDFKAISPRSIDASGNLTIGLKEQIVFPEIVYDKVDKVRGMDITIVTSALSSEHAAALLRGFYIPISE